MDPTRPLDELASQAGARPDLEHSGASSNDLEDHGGDGGNGARRRRRRPRDEDLMPTEWYLPPAGPDRPPSELEQKLDRIVSTEQDEDDTAAYRRARGQHYYREHDHATTGYYRRPKPIQQDNPESEQGPSQD